MRSQDSNKEQENEGIGNRLAPVAFLVPAAALGAAIAVAVANYAPLTYTAPAVAQATQEVAAAPELKVVDTAEVEKTSAVGLATQTDFGIDLSNVKDGTYTGSGTGFSGTITVEVTIQDGKIAAIQILSSGDDEAYFSRVRGLVDTVIAQQSLSIDTVSGATYSSRGLLSAIKNALLQATGQETEPLDEAPAASATSNKAAAVVEPAVEAPKGFANGVYEGSAEGYNGPVTVRVTIQGGKIAAVDLVSHEDDAQFDWAWAQIPAAIVSAQSTNVDTVSGATYSSKGIIAAVQKALKKAAAAAGSTIDVPDADGAAADDASGDDKKDDASGDKDPGKTDGKNDAGKTDGDEADGKTDGDSNKADGDKGDDADDAAKTHYQAGTYTGFALCSDGDEENFEPYYVAVTIEVKENKVAGITKIWGTNKTDDPTLTEVLDPFDVSNQAFLTYAVEGRTVKKVWYEGVKAQLLAGKASDKIDVVSRSTYSSRAIAAAYDAALKQSEDAYKKAHPDEEKKDDADKGDASDKDDASGNDAAEKDDTEKDDAADNGDAADNDAAEKGDDTKKDTADEDDSAAGDGDSATTEGEVAHE